MKKVFYWAPNPKLYDPTVQLKFFRFCYLYGCSRHLRTKKLKSRALKEALAQKLWRGKFFSFPHFSSGAAAIFNEGYDPPHGPTVQKFLYYGSSSSKKIRRKKWIRFIVHKNMLLTCVKKCENVKILT
jgi:hypothetical protein